MLEHRSNLNAKSLEDPKLVSRYSVRALEHPWLVLGFLTAFDCAVRLD